MEKAVYCKKCHKEIDENMKKCPNCGAKNGKGKGKLILGIIAAIIVIIVIASTGGGEDGKSTVTNDTDTASGVSSKNVETNSTLSKFEYLEDNEDMPFVITEKARAMITANSNLFTENKNVNLAAFTDMSLSYKQLVKNINNHGDYLMNVPILYVVKIYETTIDGQVYSDLQLMDEEENMYRVFSLVSYDDIFEGDMVNFYGLPIGDTTYENFGGGITPAIVFAASYIEKIEY